MEKRVYTQEQLPDKRRQARGGKDELGLLTGQFIQNALRYAMLPACSSELCTAHVVNCSLRLQTSHPHLSLLDARDTPEK